MLMRMRKVTFKIGDHLRSGSESTKELELGEGIGQFWLVVLIRVVDWVTGVQALRLVLFKSVYSSF